MPHQTRVHIAVSGGVDSATAAALLREQGYQCEGIFMITHDSGYAALSDAERVCHTVGIKLHILDFRQEFQVILDYFISEYRQARTPNPCVLCNRLMKFGKLWQFAKEHGADYFATGHYARIEPQGQSFGLFQSEDTKKDQSYVLSMIPRDVLGHILLPMSGWTKNQTRQMAARFGLHITDKKDSQEICFIPDDDYAGLLARCCPDIGRPGEIIDVKGNVLGYHQGIHQYTIGQRRGLRIAMGQPVFVVNLDADKNTVTLGPKEALMKTCLDAKQVNWLIEQPDKPFEAIVKVRYNHAGSPAMVYPQNDQVHIVFANPVSSITPGQAAVVYCQTEKGLQVAGGGWIETASNSPI